MSRSIVDSKSARRIPNGPRNRQRWKCGHWKTETTARPPISRTKWEPKLDAPDAKASCRCVFRSSRLPSSIRNASRPPSKSVAHARSVNIGYAAALISCSQGRSDLISQVVTSCRCCKSEFVADAKLHNADFVLAFRLQRGVEASEPLSDWCFTQRFTVHHRTTALPGDDCTTHSKRARLASVPATSQFWFVLDDNSSSGHVTRFLDDGDRTEKSDMVSDAGSGTDLPCLSRSRASTPPLSPLISCPIWPSGKQDMKSSQAASTLVTDRQCSNFGMLPSIKELLGSHGKGFGADFSSALSRVDYFTNLYEPSLMQRGGGRVSTAVCYMSRPSFGPPPPPPARTWNGLKKGRFWCLRVPCHHGQFMGNRGYISAARGALGDDFFEKFTHRQGGSLIRPGPYIADPSRYRSTLYASVR